MTVFQSSDSTISSEFGFVSQSHRETWSSKAYAGSSAAILGERSFNRIVKAMELCTQQTSPRSVENEMTGWQYHVAACAYIRRDPYTVSGAHASTAKRPQVRSQNVLPVSVQRAALGRREALAPVRRERGKERTVISHSFRS